MNGVIRSRVCRVEPVGTVRAEVGECPVWDAEHEAVWWTDSLAGLLHHTDLASGHTETDSLGQAIGAVVLRAAGGLAVAVQQGFGTFVDKKLELVAPVAYGTTRGRMNDGKCDSAGRFWAGAMSSDARQGQGVLYRLDRNRSLQRVLTGLGLPNGLGWSPDGQTFYHTDSVARTIRAFAFDPSGGALGGGTVIVQLSMRDGIPDGLAVDADGCIWSAIWGRSEVRRYTPKGILDTTLAVPALNPTSCAFGGPGLRTLFVTSAAQGCEEDKGPHNGALFSCEPIAVGIPVGSYLVS